MTSPDPMADDNELSDALFRTSLSASAPQRTSVRAPKMRSSADRRREALDAQRTRRRDLTAHARALAFAQPMECVAETPARIAGAEDNPRKKGTRVFAGQLMLGESLGAAEDIAGDGSAWAAVPLPAGAATRCVVCAANGATVARRTNGSVFGRFRSALPNGGAPQAVAHGRESRTFCILDCMLDSDGRTFWVRDVMCWKGYLLYDCDCDFRFFWRDTKLAETDAGTRDADGADAPNPYAFVPLPAFAATPDGIAAAMRTPGVGSLAFYHRQGMYTFGEEPTPLLCECPVTSPLLQQLLSSQPSSS